MNSVTAIRRAMGALSRHSTDMEARIPRFTATTAGQNARLRAEASIAANREAIETLGALAEHIADQAAPAPTTEVCPSSRSYTGRGEDRINCPSCNRRVATTGGGHIVRHERLAPTPPRE
jgi:hypothetical protein